MIEYIGSWYFMKMCWKDILLFLTYPVKSNIWFPIQEIMEDFIFPASKIVVQNRKNGAETPLDPIVPVCTNPLTINAAFELLVAMCVNCVANLKMVADMLTDMYYSGMWSFLKYNLGGGGNYSWKC